MLETSKFTFEALPNTYYSKVRVDSSLRFEIVLSNLVVAVFFNSFFIGLSYTRAEITSAFINVFLTSARISLKWLIV